MTPSELNREAKIHLEAGFPRLWIEGEISNLARPASGHLYFSLKDESAQLRCALFRSHSRGLGFRPENGQLVQVRGRLSLYEPRGDYQLIADAMEAAGEGRLRARFEALKKTLEQEGLFREERKKPLPRGARHIGVISSPSGAVIRDILHVLQRRWPLASVRLYPVPVQGDGARPAIVRALAAANRHGWADLLILARGGGSLEDLWAFNEEAVARAVAGSDLPVISAIGHETDVSISDFVADLRAPTPTAAAEMATPDIAVLNRALVSALDQLHHRQLTSLQRRFQFLDDLTQRLQRQHPDRVLEEQVRSLSTLRERLGVAHRRLLSHAVERNQQLTQRLRLCSQRLLPERRERLQMLARTLHVVSPLPTLERGYSVTLDATSGAAVSSIQQLKVDQRLETRLMDGNVISVVSDLQPGELGASGKTIDD